MPIEPAERYLWPQFCEIGQSPLKNTALGDRLKKISPHYLMPPNLRKLQLLTGCLIFSGSLNITMACMLWSKGRNPPALRSARLEIGNETLCERNCSVLQAMSDWEYARLIAELSNCDLVEDGFTRAGLALSILVKRCDFDVERALLDQPLQKRSLIDPETTERFTLLANLKRGDFEQIQRFAQQEQWPLTTEGIFKRAQILTERLASGRELTKAQTHLLEAFVGTEAFESMSRLFPDDTPNHCLVSIALCLGWSEFSNQKERVDLDDTGNQRSRRQLLLKAIEGGCKSAAYVLLLTDFDFALRGVSESAMTQLLSLLDTFTAEAMTMTLEVLRSPRCDQVRELATRRACYFLNLPRLASDDQWKLVARALCSAPKFAPAPDHMSSSLRPLLRTLDSVHAISRDEKSGESEYLHVVTSGDTLWKLSKRYGLTVQELMRHNRLTRDFLHIGQILQIQLATAL